MISRRPCSVLRAVLGVVLALLCAHAARLHAGLKTGAQHLWLRGRPPSGDPAGGVADGSTESETRELEARKT